MLSRVVARQCENVLVNDQIGYSFNGFEAARRYVEIADTADGLAFPIVTSDFEGLGGSDQIIQSRVIASSAAIADGIGPFNELLAKPAHVFAPRQHFFIGFVSHD